MTSSGGTNGQGDSRLIPQPHGGALLSGGVPGHKGGGGRPSSALRGSFREILEQSFDVLRDFSQGRVVLTRLERCGECGHTEEVDSELVQLKPSDITKAIDIAAKYGLGEQTKHIDEGLIEDLGRAVGEVVGDRNDASEILEEIRRRWVSLLAGRLR